jgi:hypothetical protein
MIKVLITQLGTEHDYDIITEDGGYAYYWITEVPNLQVYQSRLTEKLCDKDPTDQCLEDSDKAYHIDYESTPSLIKVVKDAVDWLCVDNGGFQCMMYQVEDLEERNKKINEFLNFK